MFTALIYDCGAAVEKMRIPIDRKTVYSYRISRKRNKNLYEPQTRRAFWAQSKALTHQFSHIAVLDITDFYNQIEQSAILNQLQKASISAIRRSSFEKLLNWTSAGSSRGIPIGPQGSHLLAEAALIPLDNFLALQHRFTDTLMTSMCSAKVLKMLKRQFSRLLTF
jgi:hypothetical protein